MELTEEVKALLLHTAKDLKGSVRRMFMARTVQALGEGGQRLAERELGWNRGTIRKGMHEAAHGIACVDGFRLVGRKRAKTICQICCAISPPLWMVRARRIRSFARRASIPR